MFLFQQLVGFRLSSLAYLRMWSVTCQGSVSSLLGCFKSSPGMHGSQGWPDTWVKLTRRTWESPFLARSFPRFLPSLSGGLYPLVPQVRKMVFYHHSKITAHPQTKAAGMENSLCSSLCYVLTLLQNVSAFDQSPEPSMQSLFVFCASFIVVISGRPDVCQELTHHIQSRILGWNFKGNSEKRASKAKGPASTQK